MPRPLHENRAELLFALACLLGLSSRRRFLNPRTIPDVIAMNPSGTALFVADAKCSETPTDVACKARIYRYVQLIGEQLQHSVNIAIFCICYGNNSHTDDWQEVVLAAAREHRLVAAGSVELFPPNSYLAAFVLTLATGPAK
jgi:hypothetical protein